MVIRYNRPLKCNSKNLVDYPNITKEITISSDSRLKVNKELCKLFADYGWEIDMSILPNIIAAYMEVLFLLTTRLYDRYLSEESCKTLYIADVPKDTTFEPSESMTEKINNIANELGFEWLLPMDETIKFIKDIESVLFEFSKKVNTFTHESGIDFPKYDFVVMHLANNKVKLPAEKYHIRYEYSADSINDTDFLLKKNNLYLRVKNNGK